MAKQQVALSTEAALDAKIREAREVMKDLKAVQKDIAGNVMRLQAIPGMIDRYIENHIGPEIEKVLRPMLDDVRDDVRRVVDQKKLQVVAEFNALTEQLNSLQGNLAPGDTVTQLVREMAETRRIPVELSSFMPLGRFELRDAPATEPPSPSSPE